MGLRNLVAFCLAALLPSPLQGQSPAPEFAIRGARILTMEGDPIEDGVIVVRDGKIAAVGKNVAIPAAARVIEARGLVAMPGIVDAEGIAPGHAISGVTDTNVFDGVESVVKLYAPAGYEDHFVRYRSALRINLGEPPRSADGRYPTTRMGIVGMVRENFLKAQGYRKRWDEWTAAGDTAKAPPARDNKMEHLTAALRGDIPVVMHAVEPMDMEAALRIADEFGLRLVLSASSMLPEALVSELRRRNVPVILGTYYAHINNHVGEQFAFRYETAAMLSGAGVPAAFGGLYGETKFLTVNAGIAAQNGMDHARALEALTIVPARVLGVDGRIGSLAPGKDADILLYRGDPLEITTAVEMTFIGGSLVYERKPFDPASSNMQWRGGS